MDWDGAKTSNEEIDFKSRIINLPHEPLSTTKTTKETASANKAFTDYIGARLGEIENIPKRRKIEAEIMQILAKNDDI